jgi:hypothetical protein
MDIDTFDSIAGDHGYTTRHRSEPRIGTAASNYEYYIADVVDIMLGDKRLATYAETIIKNWMSPADASSMIANLKKKDRMVIDENYTGRRVRVIGKEGDVTGVGISVFDVATGDLIENAYRVMILLDATEANVAQLSYYEDASDNKKDVTVSVAEVDVTAFEVGGANVD